MSEQLELEWESKSDPDKRMVYAVGAIRYFTNTDRDKSLYLDGVILSTGEEIHRNIKLSKHIRGYCKDRDSLIPYSEYPRRDTIYVGKLVLETWSWEGNHCMRVTAFQIDDTLGVGSSRLFSRNPFTSLQSYMDSHDISEQEIAQSSISSRPEFQ